MKGEVYIQLLARKADWLNSAQELYLQMEEDRSPSAYIIERAKPFKEGLIVKFEGIPDRTAAEKLRKAQVLLDESLLVAPAGETVPE